MQNIDFYLLSDVKNSIDVQIRYKSFSNNQLKLYYLLRKYFNTFSFEWFNFLVDCLNHSPESFYSDFLYGFQKNAGWFLNLMDKRNSVFDFRTVKEFGFAFTSEKDFFERVA